MAVISIPNCIVPTFLLTEKTLHTEINVSEFANKDTKQFTCIVMIKDGIYIYRGYDGVFTSFGKSEKIKQIGGLSEAGIDSDTGGYVFHSREKLKLPFEQVRFAQKFFADIYEKYKSESATIWYYHPVRHEWYCQIPIQLDMSHGGIKYVTTSNGEAASIKRAKEISEEKPEYKAALEAVENERNQLLNDGFVPFGTIHSHCDFNAFHSGTDDNDEFGFDGVHITVGHVNSQQSYSQRLIAGQLEITIDDITDIVNMGDKTIDDLRNISDLPNTLETYGDRCFFSEKKTLMQIPFSSYEDDWNYSDYVSGKAFRKWFKDRFTTNDDEYNENSKAWWEDEDKTWNKPSNSSNKIKTKYPDSYKKGDRVNFTLHGLECTGVIVGGYIPRKQDIPENTSPSYIGKMYWIKSKSFKIPVIVEHWDIEAK